MSYLAMTGKLANVLTTEARVDRKTGQIIQARHQVQLEVSSPLENGDERLDLVTLTVPDRAPYEGRKGHSVSVAVGVFVSGGKLQFFVPKRAAAGVTAERATE